MDIRCYKYINGSCILTGVVEDFNSCVFQRSYYGIGEWKIEISNFSVGAELIRNADFIKLGDGVCGLVNSSSIIVSLDDNNTTIEGVELKGLANMRIVIPPEGQSYQHYSNASPDYVMKELLRQQLTEADANRRIEGIIVGLETPLETTIDYDGRFGNVAEELFTLGITYNLGWYADIEGNDIVWHIYQGVNRTAAQQSNSRFVVSYEMDNIANSQLEQLRYVANTALVAGRGEGVERATTILNNTNTGLDRVETYIDARDIEDDALLPQRGEEKLAEYGTKITYTCEAGSSLINQYRLSYELGDSGTLIDNMFGVQIDFCLSEVTEVYEENGFKLEFGFGTNAKNLNSVLKQLKGSNDSLIRNETEYVAKSDVFDMMLDFFYPIGAVYMTTIADNPHTYLGGEWIAWGSGRVPVGVDANDTNFNTVEKTGGAETVTLALNQIPAHRHSVARTNSSGSETGACLTYNGTSTKRSWTALSGYSGGSGSTTTSAGTTQAHNNLQPYITCYMWKRTA